MKKTFSVLVPVHNEEESVIELSKQIDSVFTKMKAFYELVFIEDGSTDDTLQVLIDLSKKNKNIKVVEFRRNFGKAKALDSGFRLVNGDIVITMDGDLQDDPKEIPEMLKKIEEGYDMVSGWKKKRHDPWHKTVPSKLFNYVTSQISGVKIHDFNCGFKMYKKEVVQNLHIYGEMHRYIPALAYWYGFRVCEIPVEHHARQFGKSKYGVERLLRGLFDFFTIAFITKYTSKPMHFFGKFGFILNLFGFGISFYLAVLWFLREFFGFSNIAKIGNRPLLMLGVLLIMVGMLFFATGLLSEMIVFFYRKTNSDLINIRSIHKTGGNKKRKT